MINSLAICEDDGYTLEKLKIMAECYVKNKAWHTNIRTFSSGEELLRESGSFDVLLLDLKLPGMGGVEVAKRFGGRSQIIFVTAYKEYALDAFEVGAVHYLVKPVTKERLSIALDRAQAQLQLEKAKQETLVLQKNGVIEKIPVDDITYCEVFDHQLCIHTGSGCYEYSGTLDLLEEKLDRRFFRCHRSFLVNMNRVIRQEGEAAVLDGGESVLVSRRRRREFLRRLLVILKDGVI